MRDAVPTEQVGELDLSHRFLATPEALRISNPGLPLWHPLPSELQEHPNPSLDRFPSPGGAEKEAPSAQRRLQVTVTDLYRAVCATQKLRGWPTDISRPIHILGRVSIVRRTTTSDDPYVVFRSDAVYRRTVWSG